MNAREPAVVTREVALHLARSLEQALAPGAPAEIVRAARDAAEILALEPLADLLREFESHAGRALPAELEPARDRLLRTAARCREEGSLDPLFAARADLGGLAEELAALEWTSMPALGRDVATLGALQTLEDLPLDPRGEPALRRVRLAAPVAASLRAALDWIAGPGGFARPLALRADEGVLEVACDRFDPLGLEAAHRVISAVDGNLGPALRAGENGWMLRVPTVAPREHFLMLEQGALRLAVPWHAVLKLQSLPAAEIETRARALGMPVLAPLSPLVRDIAERPVITVAHGLRRGWLLADRVVWRLAADPCGPGEPVPAGFDRLVRSDEGEVWTVPSAWRLLEGAPMPPPPVMAPAADVAPAPAPAAEPSPRSEPAPLPATAWHAPRESAMASGEGAMTETAVLDATDVLALDEAPLAAAAPAPATARGVRRALVAEDSIATRALLSRAFSDRGFEVHTVERAEQLDQVLDHGPWAIVLLDVDLPDAAGRAYLSAARERLAHLERPPLVVALVRDREDAAEAGAAGIPDQLSKPVERERLRRWIERAIARAGSAT